MTNEAITPEQFLADVLHGLSQPRKRLPPKYFYDEAGCALFEKICQLPEYYLTRCEIAIMQRFAPEMGRWLGPKCMVIELGSGSGVKTRLLLDHLPHVAAYVPVDVARGALDRLASELARRYECPVLPVCADFLEPFSLPDGSRAVQRRVVYFPGSTVGNLDWQQTGRLLRQLASLCGDGGALLIGLDLQKDVAVLEAAYNDSAGVTAQFNLNLLRRINRQLGADFRLDRFRHHAFYNAPASRIEMHLVSVESQRVRVADRVFSLRQGESICTEYSHKYDLEDFCRFAARFGWRRVAAWLDRQRYFAVVAFEQHAQPTRR